MAANCAAPANTKMLMAATSSTENPARWAASPYTKPKASPDAAIPSASIVSLRRDSATAAAEAVMGRGASAQERLAARPVADDVHRVLVDRVARGVEEAVAALRRTFPD